MATKTRKTTAARKTKTRAKRKAPAPKRRVGAGVWLRLPMLEQRELDLIGLFLVAVGIFLACVMYLGWAGGEVGGAMTDGVRYLVGTVGYAVPVGLVAAGFIVVMRPMLPTGRPFGTGAACLLAGCTLAYAAGTLGFGPEGARTDVWERAFVQDRGGLLGQALYTGVESAASQPGVHILSLFLLVAAVLLITGATIAGVIHASRTSLAGTTRALRETTAGLGALRRPGEPVAPPPESLQPPEPPSSELVVRATHVEAPPIDGPPAVLPDLFGAAPLPEIPAAVEEATVAEEPPMADDEEQPGVTKAQPSPEPAESLTPQGRYRAAVTEDPDFEWKLPDAGKLKRSTGEAAKPDTTGQEQVAAQLVETLAHFRIEAKVINTITGPHITRYEMRLAPGTKVSKVAQLKDDIAYSLAASEIRILAPIPGKQAVGVEVPNKRRRIVHLGDVFQDPPADWSPLTVWLGKDVAGRAIGADLTKMPHLLVAGTTGAGKSGAINAMLSSVLLRATPHELRLVLVDPKQVELNHYDSIPHLLTPVITSPRMAATALQNLVREMESRYGMMSLARTRSLTELNRARAKRDEPALPYILCVIDELADLMMVAPADVEDSVIRLAQKARAVGIHLVLATQSPRVDVITGMIKANVPSRIAFAVSSQTDSRVILDQNGAEALLGEGDMLFAPVGSSRLQRIQGAYIDEAQIARLTDHWRKQGEPEFHEELLEEVEDAGADAPAEEFSPDEDPLLDEAIALVAQMGTASTSMLQRRLRLGYTRAGRLIDMLERRGVISGYEGSKPRQVLIGEADVPRIVAALRERSETAPVGGPPAPEPPDADPDD
ncbi:MAG TPA: DNA translocase FtsK 4TM domain-containing protein [Solirubrobacteraceae bacterium]|nr:DNA translocase FtsK 4TM domain-containing protein [Solirubrobacteraceae bacterium]